MVKKRSGSGLGQEGRSSQPISLCGQPLCRPSPPYLAHLEASNTILSPHLCLGGEILQFVTSMSHKKI
eukprot:jgi/Botrbrau1/17739/Bobra.0127s0004.1